MVWCSSCAMNIERPANMGGTICCSFCGRVLDEDNFSCEPTFIKNAAGQSQLGGSFVKSIQNEYSVSRQRILEGARDDMDMMLNSLHEENRDSIVSTALNFYTIAVERNFTRGRRRELVEAACVYLACRENKKPYLLIDFAEYLQINVYVIGAVFLQLCKLLSLQEHPIVQKPVDPSLFIHRFANGLVGEDHYKEVARDALHIIFKMKRDWMQTGRKPSGICGAALYVSAISHCGRKYTKSDIQRIVHVCEATLTKRLIEFEETESGSLTIEEFAKNADELERECRSIKQPETGMKENILLCEHKGSGIPVFAHGLCRSCYEEFVEFSGGLEGGSDPPAFQRAERERKAKECAEKNVNDSSVDDLAYDTQNNSNNLNVEKEPDVLEASRTEKLQSADAGTIGDGTKHVETDGGFDKFQEEDGSNTKESDDEPENFCDIDDIEVDGYIHNEREQRLKKIIWEELNKEYLEEQAAKEAAAAAAKAAYEANLSNHPDDVKARELAAAANARVAKSRKEKQQKRAAEAKNAAPPQTAAEATKQMLTRKRLSSKINYDVLDKLFDEPEPIENPKKIRKEEENTTVHKSKNDLEAEEGKQEEDDEYEEDATADIAADLYYDPENVDTYDYDDDYGYDGF